jgi:hypothetical protein
VFVLQVLQVFFVILRQVDFYKSLQLKIYFSFKVPQVRMSVKQIDVKMVDHVHQYQVVVFDAFVFQVSREVCAIFPLVCTQHSSIYSVFSLRYSDEYIDFKCLCFHQSMCQRWHLSNSPGWWLSMSMSLRICRFLLHGNFSSFLVLNFH